MINMQFFNIHTHHFDTLNPSVFNAHIQKGVWTTDLPCFSIGIHPWWIDECGWETELQMVKSIAEQAQFIGEVGLDKMIPIDFGLQIKVFERHIQLSEKIEKPLLIHCVRSFNEILQIQKKWQPRQAWILHGFNHRKTILNELLNNGFYISIGAAVLQPKSMAAQSIQEIPLNRLFLETDSSLIPIETIYDKVAEYKKMEGSILCKSINTNFKNIGVNIPLSSNF